MNRQALNHSLEYIKSWLAFRYERAQVPGYVVAVAYKGEVLLNEAYGFADLERNIKLTPEHIFRVASHSKTFTATALMQLVEAGKLRLEDKAVDYLPWLQEHTDKRWRRVTIRQLLSHGAGVIRDGLNADYWQLERPFPDEAELKKEVLKAGLVIDVNTKLKYSNYGYSLLGLIIENISGQAYGDYVTENIIEPLGLTHTGPEYTSELADKIVTGYTRREVEGARLPIAHINTRAMAAATGFYSNAKDLCLYFSAHCVGSGKLLGDESKKEMQRVHWHTKSNAKGEHTDYGLGLSIDFAGKRRTIGHGGGFPGHITKTMADPQDELVVVVLTNCVGGPAGPIAKGVYEVIDYYQKNTPDAKPKHDLQKLEGRYMNLFSITDIIVTGDKVLAVYPDSWEPLSEPEELEYVHGTTLKVIDTDSFSSEDELVHFNFRDGVVETVNYTGYTLWPETAWVDKQASRKSVA